MAKNPERRTALLDAAIEVLASEGARGLTFRAVDIAAKVPIGTASNYFANRDALLAQVSVRAYERFMPDATGWENALTGPRDRAVLTELMQDVVHRLIHPPTVYLALLELRLEATRRPALRENLTKRVSEDLEDNIAFHEKAEMPGDRRTVTLLHLALNWLVTEHLTLPGVLAAEGTPDELTALVVERIVSEE